MALAAPLSAEDQCAQSMPDASPTKWHLAHTTWFFETMILAEAADYVPFDRAYGYLFNSYYEALGPRQPRMERGLLTRPSVQEVGDYRAHVDAAVLDRLDRGLLPDPLLARLVVGLAHEEQHQELILTDVLHLLAQNPLRPAYSSGVARPPVRSVGQTTFITLEGGVVEIGAKVGDGLSTPFAFDNEGPRHRAYLLPFLMADRLVSNDEYAGFIADRGYERPELWLSDGWAAVRANAWSAPGYWERDGDGWRVFGSNGLEALEPAAPVDHVSYFEADAFARWSGRRLPTEAEWEVAASTRAESFDDLFGTAWQWTASAYAPYPGFVPAPGALGEYNGKFMVSQLVLRGSSWATAPDHARATYRNFFPPMTRWQITGIRLADDAPPTASGREAL